MKEKPKQLTEVSETRSAWLAAQLRRDINYELKDNDELDRFLLDHFPEIKIEISAGMTRTQRTNLLLEKIEHSLIQQSLITYRKERVTQLPFRQRHIRRWLRKFKIMTVGVISWEQLKILVRTISAKIREIISITHNHKLISANCSTPELRGGMLDLAGETGGNLRDAGILAEAAGNVLGTEDQMGSIAEAAGKLVGSAADRLGHIGEVAGALNDAAGDLGIAADNVGEVGGLAEATGKFVGDAVEHLGPEGVLGEAAGVLADGAGHLAHAAVEFFDTIVS